MYRYCSKYSNLVLVPKIECTFSKTLRHEKKEHLYRGVAYSSSDIQRRYLSIVVNDDFVEKTVHAILEAAKTGEVGDGKIFVTPVEEAYRIRTGESGGLTLK